MANSVTQTIIVKGGPAKIYNIWADFETFPSFMSNVQSVTVNKDGVSHWVMKGPLGVDLEWDAEVTRKDENKRIAWRSRSDSTMQTSGQVTFTTLPNDETQITATIHYVPPSGLAGEVAAGLFGDPEGRLMRDLRNFKTFVEGGPEAVATEANQDLHHV